MPDTHVNPLSVLFPPRCAGCGAPGTDCCAACAGPLRSARPVSRAVLPIPAFALGEYRGATRRLILAYKERGRRDLGAVLGHLLARALLKLPGQPRAPDRAEFGAAQWLLVPAPSRRCAARMRGGAHMTRVAAACAAALTSAGVPASATRLLALGRGVRDAVGLDRTARMANLAGRVTVRAHCLRNVTHSSIRMILLDDVITTGATAASCAAALAAEGLAPRLVLAVAATGRDATSRRP
ncbi:ComF family protein [Tamaricihabitans halophyticus]|nr:ComF family protein [Tamaricihabitans halophyticus]